MTSTRRTKLILPSRFSQRGSVSAFPHGTGAAAGVSAGNLVLTDFASSFVDLGSNTVWSGFRLNTDGSIDERGPGVADYNQVHAGEWWADEPETDIGDGYECRVTSTSGDAWDIEAEVEDTWIRLDASREWSIRVLAIETPEVSSVSTTLEIGVYLASSADVTATWSTSAEN